MNNLLLLLLSMMYSTINSLPMDPKYPSTIILTPFNTVGEMTNKKIAQVTHSKALAFVPVFPDSGRTHAVLGTESPVSKADSAYSYLQQWVANFYHPKPIVDTIQEHEKYGNDGEKFRSVGTAVVAGFEGFSNLLNAAIDVPFEAAKQLGKKISSSINVVGAKLVGL